MKNELTKLIAKGNDYTIEYFAMIERGAWQGDAADLYSMAKVLLSNTELAKPDTEKAHTMLCQSAMFGNLKAKMLLAHLYHEGYTGFDNKSIDRNPNIAFKLFSECANSATTNDSGFRDHALAIERLGDYFLERTQPDNNDSHWLSADYLEGCAFRNYEQAADMGLASAQFKQAIMHKEGKGTHKCIVSAQYMLHKSAKQGYAPALAEYDANRELYT